MSILNFFNKLINRKCKQQINSATLLTTNIIVKVNGSTIGAIQSITIKETASSDVTRGTIDGICSRVRFDGLRISEVFCGKIHIVSNNSPFDIEIYEQYNKAVRKTTLKNCVITEMEYTYSADNWIIIDHMKFTAKDIVTENELI